MNKINKILLVVFLLLGLFLGFWHLENTDFTADEGHYAYDAFQFYKGNPGMVPRYHPANHGHEHIGHPFLAPHLISFSYEIFKPSIYSSRLVSAISGFLTIILIFLIGRKIFNEKTALIAMIIYSVFPLSVIYARTVYLDSLLTFLIAVFLLLYLQFNEKKNCFLAISLGVILALIMLTKLDGPLMLIFLFLDLIIVKGIKKIKNEMSFYFLFLVSLIIVFIIGVSPKAYLLGIIEPSDRNFLNNNIFFNLKIIFNTLQTQNFLEHISLIYLFLFFWGIYDFIKRKTYVKYKNSIYLILLMIAWLPLVWLHMTGRSGLYGLLPLIFIAIFFIAYRISLFKKRYRQAIIGLLVLFFLILSVKQAFIKPSKIKPIDNQFFSYLKNLEIPWEKKIYLYERPRNYCFAEQELNFIIDPALLENVVKNESVYYVVSTDNTEEGRKLNKFLQKSNFKQKERIENQLRGFIIFEKIIKNE